MLFTAFSIFVLIVDCSVGFLVILFVTLILRDHKQASMGLNYSSNLPLENIASSPLCQNSTKVDSYKHEWVITSFRTITNSMNVGYFLKSDPFAIGPGYKDSFEILLYPQGFNERVKGHASVWLKKQSSKELNIRFTCCALDSNKQIICQKSIQQSLALESCLGWSAFCRSSLLDDKKGQILGKSGDLTLLCAVEYFKDMAVTKEVDLLPVMHEINFDLKQLLFRGDFHDFTILTGTDKFPVHKAILSARSSVFKKMFEGSKSKELYNITLNDVSSKTLKQMLVFMYSGEIGSLDVQDSLRLYKITDQYKVLTLKGICCKILKDNVSVDNVFDVLLLAFHHFDRELEETCVKCMSSNAQKVQRSKKWIMLLKSYPDLANRVIEKMILK